MEMFLENFITEKQWQQFLGYYRKENLKPKGTGSSSLNTVAADENIWPFVISAFWAAFNVPLLVIAPTLERAWELESEISCIVPKAEIFSFPSLGNSIFYKNKTTPVENITKRLNTIKNLLEGSSSRKAFFVITTSNSLLNLMPSSKAGRLKSIKILTGSEYGRDELINKFVGSGYERVNQVYDRGEFSVRGEIIDIFDITGKNPVRIDFLEDEAEKIFFYDLLKLDVNHRLNRFCQ